MDRPRVLLVEDNRLLRWWMARSLERNGFVVFAPDPPLKALALARECAIDLLVTDWHLGEGLDGFEMLAHVRRNSPRVYGILISAEADENLARLARKAGFDAVIRKPFPIAEIVGAARNFTQGRGPRERQTVPEGGEASKAHPLWHRR